MKAWHVFLLSVVTTTLLTSTGCESERQEVKPKSISTERLDIGLDALIDNSTDLIITVTPRSPGFTATAKGKGTIPSGEYAGQNFKINISGYYSALGNGTLLNASATVRIQSERFVSVTDAFLQSFCCGEGDILLVDGEYIFTMFGQVSHSTASPPHNHLFAALATTEGTMNMNIADQTGTVVEQATPPHDPGIGLLIGFDAQRVDVVED